MIFTQIFLLYLLFNVSYGRKKEAKIVGGPTASISNYPYQLSLEINNTFHCGAVLVAPNRALTAAQCTLNYEIAALSVRGGTSLRNQGGTVRNVSRVCTHPNFNTTNYDNDIAVLVLETDFTASNQISVIGLATIFNYLPDRAEAVITGWGSKQLNGPLAPHLHSVTMLIISRGWCALFYRGNHAITQNMLCTGRFGRGVCTGDAGGPLTYVNQLFGIVSRDSSCGRFTMPGVYTDVRRYTSFINNCQ